MRKLSMEELHRLSKDQYKEVTKLPVVVVLDNIRSLSNVGSVFRSADAFRIGELFLCGITACPPHREIHKTALGADETVPWAPPLDNAERWIASAPPRNCGSSQIR